MTDRARELGERSAALRVRCAVQRRAVADEIRALEDRLQSVDRAVTWARSTVLHPAGLALGFVAMLWLGRTRGAGVTRLITRGLLLATAARRVLGLVKKL